MTTDKLALREPQALQPFEAIKQSVEELNKFYTKLMQKGTDYDTIPGTPKPTLLKSGAELLRLRFGFNPQFKISKGLTDVQRGFIEYDIVCSLYKDGEVLAEGVGNANSLESKWRYRWLNPWELPQDFDKAAAFKTYGLTRKTKKGTYQYRFDNENPQDQVNTILKIAKKRAFVDAILTATGASRIFTQDIEEMASDVIEESVEAPGEPTDGITPSPSTNPLVEAAMAAGAVVQEVCAIHGVVMEEGYSAKTKQNYWYHDIDGERCFSNVKPYRALVAEMINKLGWHKEETDMKLKEITKADDIKNLSGVEKYQLLQKLSDLVAQQEQSK